LGIKILTWLLGLNLGDAHAGMEADECHLSDDNVPGVVTQYVPGVFTQNAPAVFAQ